MILLSVRVDEINNRCRLIRRSVIFFGAGATNAAVPGLPNGTYDGKKNCGGAQGAACCVNAWDGAWQEYMETYWRGTGMSGGSGFGWSRVMLDEIKWTRGVSATLGVSAGPEGKPDGNLWQSR